MGVFLIILVCIGAFAFFFVYAYNRLVVLHSMAQEAWSGVDVQLKRRYDLIPNLINTVKGYAKHESDLLENITKARSAAMAAHGPQGKSVAEENLGLSLRSLLVAVENYPDLKAQAGFLELQKSLNTIETDIQLARRYYNGSVREFNIRTQIFPSSLVASMVCFKALPYFGIDELHRQAPEVRF